MGKSKKKPEKWLEIYKTIKNKTNWPQKFRNIIHILNREVQSIAAEIGFTFQGIDKVLRGSHAPSYAMLNDMVRFLHIRQEWLFSINENGSKDQIFFAFDRIKGSKHEIAQRILEVRKEQDMTQRQFSEFTGLALTTVNYAEQAKFAIREDTLRKISESCNVGFYWLLSGYTEDRDNPCSLKMVEFLWRREPFRQRIWMLMNENDELKGAPDYKSISGAFDEINDVWGKAELKKVESIRDGTKMDPQEIGDRIHSVREYRNLSQRAFAAVAGISKSAVGLWEKGKTIPDDFSIRRIGEAFDVGIDWIKYGDESRKNYPCDHKMIEFLNVNPVVRKAIWDMM